MNEEEKQLLVIDLCGRLHYGVKLSFNGNAGIPRELTSYDRYGDKYFFCAGSFTGLKVESIKPYLRPMSSMTKEERAELSEIIKTCGLSPYGEITESGEDNLLRCTVKQAFLMLNYLYSKHFDINHLIDPGLAIEAPEGMY